MFASVTSPSRRKLVEKVYNGLRKRISTRQTGTITTDDVHELLDKQKFPRSFTKRQSIIATLLNNSVFVQTGVDTPSRRPAAKGRYVLEWTL